MKGNEGNHQGAVDKSFSEQRIHIVDANYIVCEKHWTRTHSETASYGRQVAGGRRNTGEFGNFEQSLYIERFNFLLRLTKVQHHYSRRNAFHVFLWVKSIVKLVF